MGELPMAGGAGPVPVKPAAAMAHVALEPGRIAEDQSLGGDVAGDHGARSDKRIAADRDPGQDGAAASHGRSIFDRHAAYCPVRFALEPAVGCYGPRMPVVQEAGVRPDEYTTAQPGAPVDGDAVLELDPIAYLHTHVDVDALSQHALAPESRSFADLGLVPDSRAGPDLGRVRDIGGWVDFHITSPRSHTTFYC